MKKALLLVVTTLLLWVLVLPGCGRRGPSEQEPFTLDYKTDSTNSRFFLDGDTFNTLVSGSPFYSGAYALPGQRTQEYEERRAKKVDEIIAASAQIPVLAAKVRPAIDQMRGAFLDFLTACSKKDKKLDPYVMAAMKTLCNLQAQEALALVSYDASTSAAEPAWAKTSLDFQKTLRALKVGVVFLEDADCILTLAAQCANAYSKSGDARIKEALVKLDTGMSQYDSAREDLAAMGTQAEDVLYGIRQLQTGDYYLALSAMEFMDNVLPEVAAKVKALKPGPGVAPEDIALVGEGLVTYTRTHDALKKILASFDKSRLVEVSFADSYPSCVWAFKDGGNYEKGYTSIADGLRKEGTGDFGTFVSTTWEAAKKAPSAAVEMADLYVHVGATVVSGVAGGKSLPQIKKDCEQHYTESERRFQQGIQGSRVLRNAKDMMDILEEEAEQTASNAVKGTLGGTFAPWAAGKVTKAVTGMFTGFAKGVYVITDPQASTSEKAGGFFDIGCSLVGGSKIAARPTMLSGIGARIGSWLKGAGAGATAGLEAAARKTAENAILQTNRAILAQIAKLGGAYASQGGKTAMDSLRDVAMKTFTANMAGLKQALATIVGERGGTFLDNVFSELVDNTVQSLIVEALKQAPTPEELRGLWKGTTVLTDFRFPKEANSEGCDFSKIITALKGKPLATSMTFDGSLDGSGKVILAIRGPNGKGGSPTSASYLYKDGHLSIQQAMKGGSVAMSGTASRQGEGYAIAGSIRMNMAGKTGNASIGGSWRVAR